MNVIKLKEYVLKELSKIHKIKNDLLKNKSILGLYNSIDMLNVQISIYKDLLKKMFDNKDE